MKKTINNLFLLFLKWRLSLFAVTLFFVPLSVSIQSLSNFDGLKFLKLAELGYGTPQTYYSYNLLPLYPTLISFFSGTFGYFNSAITLSSLFTFLSVLVLFALIKYDYKESQAKLGIALLLLSPGAFFLNATYSESLFLFLATTSLLFVRRGNFLLSAIFASLASYTRAAGIILLLVIMIEYFERNKHIAKAVFDRKILSLLIAPLGFLYYLRYLEINTSDFLNFLPSLPEKFVFLHQVFLRYLKMVIFIDHTSHLFVVVLTELFLSLLALYLLVFRFKQTRLSYWIYLLAVFFIPSLWGSFTGIARFLLTCPPFFIMLSDWLIEKPNLKKPILITFAVFLVANLIIFTKGLFVG